MVRSEPRPRTSDERHEVSIESDMRQLPDQFSVSQVWRQKRNLPGGVDKPTQTSLLRTTIGPIMPTKFNIPSRVEHHCSPCEFHVCTSSFHVRSGEGSWREYSCKHPDAPEPLPEGGKHHNILVRILARELEEGRPIGRTELQPQWCPLKRNNA